MSEIARVLYDLGILSILLLLGVFLRKKVRFLQNLYTVSYTHLTLPTN